MKLGITVVNANNDEDRRRNKKVRACMLKIKQLLFSCKDPFMLCMSVCVNVCMANIHGN